jgi:hypothetical protein
MDKAEMEEIERTKQKKNKRALRFLPHSSVQKRRGNKLTNCKIFKPSGAHESARKNPFFLS